MCTIIEIYILSRIQSQILSILFEDLGPKNQNYREIRGFLGFQH